jgi:RND family efflux transporter MFP subunit
MAAEEDRKVLLDALKIDRDAPSEADDNRRKWWLAGVGVIILAGLSWYFGVYAAQQTVTVKTAVAVLGNTQSPVNSVLDATGYVVARRQATVSSKTTGKVVEVLIEEGVVVEQGQLLARLDDSIPQAQYDLAQSQLNAAQAGLAELQVSLQQAHLDLERTQNLTQKNLASTADLDRDRLAVDALNARMERVRTEIEVAASALAVQSQLLADMQIRAPFAGVVIAKAAQPGEMISPVSAGGGFTRTGICTIVDMNSLEIEVDVNESYINRVYAQQPVRVTLNAYEDVQFPAAVIAIIPAADRNKATVRVRVGLLEHDVRVLPDMGVRVAFLEEQASAEVSTVPLGVWVPANSIGRDGDTTFVFVVRDNQAQRRSVSLGETQGTRVQVFTGLSAGDRVVTAVASVVDQISAGARVDVSR